MAVILRRIGEELGIQHLAASASPRDVALLIISRFARMLAFGAVAPILVLFLSDSLKFDDARVGLFLSLTLIGDVALSMLVSFMADRVGRRRVLALGALAMLGSGIVFYTSEGYVPLLLAATFGVISRPLFSFVSKLPRQLTTLPPLPSAASGNEVGPFSAVESSILSQLVKSEDRIFLLMWYQILGFIGLAGGSVLGGHLASSNASYRIVFLFYGLSALFGLFFSVAMTPYCELDHPPLSSLVDEAVEPTSPLLSDSEEEHLTPERRPLLDRTASSTPYVVQPSSKLAYTDGEDSIIAATLPEEDDEPASALPLIRLLLVAALFSVDSFASSLTPASYVSFYFVNLGASLRSVTGVLAGSALGAVATSLLAGALVKRIGLVLSMCSTHLPAQILTIAMAFAPSLPSLFGLYISRTMLSSIDSSIRSALLSAMVPKSERTRLLGIIDVCRTLAAAPGPFVTGRLVSIGALSYTFVISGGIKIGYDLALLVLGRSTKLNH
ncbi:hypothetical protein JCM8547_003402 [Rhodosporidiobolus lusitaniae]